MKVQFTATIEMEMPDFLLSSEQQQEYAEHSIYCAYPYEDEEYDLCVFSMSNFTTVKK